VPERFGCPALDGVVEVSEERLTHVRLTHPESFEVVRANLARVLSQPDVVYHAEHNDRERMFACSIPPMPGHFVVAIVVTDETAPTRHWVVTAWVGRRLPGEGGRWVLES